MNRTLRFNRSRFADAYRRNRDETMHDFTEGIQSGEFRLGEKTALADVVEGFFDIDFEHMARSGRGFMALESADVQTVADFRTAMSQFMLLEAQRAWAVPGLIADNLVTNRQSTTKAGLPREKVPYWPLPSDNDDDTYFKKDGDNYKSVGAASGYVEMDGPQAYGARIAADRSLALVDKTGGQTMEHLRNQVVGLRVRREKQMLSKILGVTGTWKFGPYDAAPVTEYTHFLTSGLYVNSYANTLTDWNSFKTVWLKLLAVTDPVTAQAMQPPTNIDVVVPPALLPLLQQILKATSVGVVDNQANSGTVRFFGPNPVNDLPLQITVHSNQYVYLTTSSNTTWFAGDFKAAYRNCQLWPFEVLERGTDSPRYFEADILYEQRFGFCELVNGYMPFRVTKNT